MRTLKLAICAALIVIFCGEALGHTPAERHRDLVAELSRSHGREFVIALLTDPRVHLDFKMLRPSMTWAEFEREVMHPTSVRKGVFFMYQHEETFRRAEREYGTDRFILLAIFRVETDFGDMLGENPVLTVLYNEYFRAPDGPRGNRKRAQVVSMMLDLLRFAQENRRDPFTIYGSRSGAVGLPQFMPFNLHYAVDGNGDGFRDLFHIEDAVPSAANFLVRRGRYNQVSLHETLRRYNPHSGYIRLVQRYASEVERLSRLLGNPERRLDRDHNCLSR